MFPLAAQYWCGTPALSISEKQDLKNALESTIDNKKARKAQQYTINIRPKIIHSSDNVIRFTEAQLLEIINEANRIFDQISIKLIIVDDKIEHIYDDNYYDLKLKNENLLRKNNDVSDGINIYFTQSITSNELSILNGFTRLPNLGNNSNIIILSYLDNTPSVYTNLKNKIFPHELGHYFGLLHTYENSNHEDLLEREFVTRGTASNCALKGDQICDTPADPFERMPDIFSLDCNESLPATLYDYNGERYYPLVNNIMSYQNKCGNEFTVQQYQRMENSLNIRLSPKAEYKLASNSSNFISISKLNTTSFCPGDNIEINYELTGKFDSKNEIIVELSDDNGNNFRILKNYTLINNSQIKIPVSAELPAGKNYRISISSTLPATQSPLSESIEIKWPPSVEISATSDVINLGKSTSIVIKFGGTGPWNFTDWDGQIYENVNFQNIFFNVKPTENFLYGISKISNSCGTINQKPSVLIFVVKPTLTIAGEQVRTYCEYSKVVLEVSNKSATALREDLMIQISGVDKDVIVTPLIEENRISFNLPIQLKREQVYAMSVIGKNMGDFSSEILFTIKEPPTQPSIVSPYFICFGENNRYLKAAGKNLKWYNINNEFLIKDSLLVNSKTPNTAYYYVSQSDDFGCESLKSKVEVIVNKIVSGSISGSKTIKPDSLATLIIQFSGLPPFEAEISNYGLLSTFDSLVLLKVKPISSIVYKLLKVSNRCGTGIAEGSATINVDIPLNVFYEININSKPVLYPNPSTINEISFQTFQNEDFKITIFDLNGKLVFQSLKNYYNNSVTLPDKIINGKYLIKLQRLNHSYQYHFILNR